LQAAPLAQPSNRFRLPRLSASLRKVALLALRGLSRFARAMPTDRFLDAGASAFSPWTFGVVVVLLQFIFFAQIFFILNEKELRACAPAFSVHAQPFSRSALPVQRSSACVRARFSPFLPSSYHYIRAWTAPLSCARTC
jgi:hypothetical protein